MTLSTILNIICLILWCLTFILWVCYMLICLFENNNFKKEKTMVKFDRDTALAVLKDLSTVMYPSNDIFVGEILVISRDSFETIRKKYLDKEKNHG